ncbi:MAG: ABC transporter permease [Candidatus Omnitrophica bacterium]|nr:ABC transporter permease [Candidatus Omnitrophota bacterium]
MLAWRDLLVRYKHAALGLGWSVLRPLLTMVVFVIVFGKVAKLPSDGLPYSLLVLSALLPWMLFANTLAVGASSLIDNAAMLRRTYFPRLLIPTTSILIHLSDALLTGLAFIFLALFFGVGMDAHILLVPFLILHTGILTLGVVYFLSVLAVYWRDVIFIVPFMIQIGFFVSPIGYSTSLIPDEIRYVFYLNPMVGLIEVFRWSLLAGKVPVHWDAYLISLILTTIIFTAGICFFYKQDQNMADIL